MGKKKGGPKELELNEMKKGKLRKYIIQIFKEIDREREERNFFMLEREKQFLFWNMLLEQIFMEKEKARLLAIQFDEAERQKEKDMNTHKQKLRSLMSEQTQKLSQARLMNLHKMKRVQDEIWEIMMMLRDAMLDKHQEWRHAQRNLYEILQNLQKNHTDEITALRVEFASEIKRMSEASERKNDAERKRIDAANAVELTIIRAEKEKQIRHMLHMHEKQLLGMKTFFNDLEVNNMAVISSLQQDIARKKLTERRLQRTLNETISKYDTLMTQTELVEIKMLEWTGEQNEMEIIKHDLSAGKNQLEQNERYIRLMGSANEALLQKIQYIENERNALRDCFAKSVINSQMRATMQRIVNGIRIRGEEGGLSDAASNIKGFKHRPEVCEPLQPIFKKPPFKFNQCIFPTAPYSHCQIPIRRRNKWAGVCDQPQEYGVRIEELGENDEEKGVLLPPINTCKSRGVKFASRISKTFAKEE